MTQEQSLYEYILRFADTSLVMGQRTAEWCSCGPILEEDLALSNISLDYFGQAESFYNTALRVVNNTETTADDLAFKRSEREYFNYLMAEQENGDYAQTQIKLYFISSFLEMVYEKLSTQKNEALAILAQKAIKEIKYHKRHSEAWVYRLANGTLESAQRIQEGFNVMWRFVDDFFIENEIDDQLKPIIGFKISELKDMWVNQVNAFLQRCQIAMPTHNFMITGGINKMHTEYLGHILCEMQYLQRVMPDAVWQ